MSRRTQDREEQQNISETINLKKTDQSPQILRVLPKMKNLLTRISTKHLSRWLNLVVILTILNGIIFPVHLASAATPDNTDSHWLFNPHLPNEARPVDPDFISPISGLDDEEKAPLTVSRIKTSPPPWSSFIPDTAQINTSSFPAEAAAIQQVQAATHSGLIFIENVGQFDSKARFMVRGSLGTLYLAEDALWFSVLEPPDPQDQLTNRTDEADPQALTSQPQRGVNLKLSFPGANPNPRLEPFNPLNTAVSYFIGDNPNEWQTNVPVWSGVRYVDIYPGVDLEITGHHGQLVQRLVVRETQATLKPAMPDTLLTPQNADPANTEAKLANIRMRVEGANNLALNGNGVRLDTAIGNFSLPLLQPVAADGTPLSLPAAQPEVKDREISNPFTPASTAALEPATLPTRISTGLAAPLPLGLIPVLQDNSDDLLYATYLGGADTDNGNDISVDEIGNAYIVGKTRSANFPITSGVFDTTHNGGYDDAFAVKLSADGTSLIYATFLGGSSNDEGKGIAVDGTGNAYIVGETRSANFPTTSGAFDSSYNGDWDAFVVKLNVDGTGLVYATYLGGDTQERGHSIAIDGSDYAYVTGQTQSSNFIPTGVSGFDTIYNGGDWDAFVVKINPDGMGLAYATYLGGSSFDAGQDISTDTSGNAYIVGATGSSDFIPAGVSGFDTSWGGWYDIFVVKINADGMGLAYATYLGGSETDQRGSIAIDQTGNVYLTGETWSSDFIPTGVTGFDTTYGGSTDAFIVKMNADGMSLAYATYLGGSDIDSGRSTAIDGLGNVYVTGLTLSTDFIPPGVSGFDTSHGNSSDGFVVKVNPDGMGLAYATYLGGSASGGSSSYDYGSGIAVDEIGNVYVTGSTGSSDFIPSGTPGFDSNLEGSGDAFVAKLELGDPCTPPGPLSDIGQAVATVVPPAQGDCGSTFEELITIPPTDPSNGTDGTYAFEQFAELARNAKYEVDFTSMNWDTDFFDPNPDDEQNVPGAIFLQGLRDLFNQVTNPENYDNYPRGMTVRILMGLYEDGICSKVPFLGEFPPYFKEDVLSRGLYNELFPTRYKPDGSLLWKLEVADYKAPCPRHSHVKTMIVDGKTVIVTGYNMSQNQYFRQNPDQDITYDIGMKLSGAVAQDALEMFDNLWEGATICTDYEPTLKICTNTEVASLPSHAPEVLNPVPTGNGLNAFSLFRSADDSTGNDAIFTAMTNSQNRLNIVQNMLWYSPPIRWEVPAGGLLPLPAGFDYETEIPPYIEGIMQAVTNNSQVRYIAAWDPIQAYLGSAYSVVHVMNLAESRGLDLSKLEIKKSSVPLHAKSLSIDNQMLIVGSLDFAPGSWSYSGGTLSNILDLAEYDIAVDEPLPHTSTAIDDYDALFEGMWANFTTSFLVAEAQIGPNIQDLVAQAVPYDTIILPAGVYQESIIIDKPLEIVGLSGENTIIEPPAGQPAFQVTSSNVSIHHLTVQNSTEYGIELIDSSPSSLENIFIRKVLFKDNALGGVLVEGLIPGSPIDYTLENNTFIGGQHGVRLNVLEEQVITSTLRNNLFFEQTEVPIKIDSATDGGVDYGYNLFNNCARASGGDCPTAWYEGALSAGSNVHDNLLNLDPEFSDPANEDYTLLPTSPAIDAGDPATINERGLNGYIPQRADIGAFETELMVDPGPAFGEVGGQVVMEAEHFTWGNQAWIGQADLVDYTGSGYLSTLPDVDLQYEPPDTLAPNPSLEYTIHFTTTGTYYVWLRGYAPNGAGDSLYMALDDQPVQTLTGFTPRIWSWAGAQADLSGGAVTISVTEPGIHILRLWQREDGLRLDRILLTTDGNYTPTGNGPPESYFE